MQISEVNVVFKSRDRNNMSNYKAICSLLIFLTTLKIILKRITSLADKYTLLSPSQCGFLLRKPTETSLQAQK